MTARPAAPVASRGIGRGVRLFHWGSAALVAAAFGLAWSFDALGPGATAGRLVAIHRTVGLTILAVTALRLAWRAAHPLPPHAGPAWELWLARAVQAGLYAGLVAQPLLGWVASNAQGDSVGLLGLFPVPDLVDPDPDRADALFALHKALGWTLLGLLGLHVAGALRHGWMRDGVLRRMVTGAPPPARS